MSPCLFDAKNAQPLLPPLTFPWIAAGKDLFTPTLHAPFSSELLGTIFISIWWLHLLSQSAACFSSIPFYCEILISLFFLKGLLSSPTRMWLKKSKFFPLLHARPWCLLKPHQLIFFPSLKPLSSK